MEMHPSPAENPQIRAIRVAKKILRSIAGYAFTSDDRMPMATRRDRRPEV